MTGSHNADEQWRENNAQGEDNWRTANSLRGRLLAERMASRNATEEAEQLQIRLLQVEGLLKQEAKSRNKAEKKLKLLMKRLQCINISHESEISVESSINSSASSFVGSNQNSKRPSEVEDEQLMGSSVDEDGSSMAIVPVNVEEEDGRIQPEILDTTVKQVLESLRRAKEQIQSSMERRRMMSMSMIKVG